MLEVAKFPFCAAGAKCTNGARYGGFASKTIVDECNQLPDFGMCGCYKRGPQGPAESEMTTENGCKVELTIGESNPVQGPRQPSSSTPVSADDSSGQCAHLESQGLCNDNLGNQTALLFGAYRGAAGAESYFDG